jgi:hypothetical protein
MGAVRSLGENEMRRHRGDEASLVAAVSIIVGWVKRRLRIHPGPAQIGRRSGDPGFEDMNELQEFQDDLWSHGTV